MTRTNAGGSKRKRLASDDDSEVEKVDRSRTVKSRWSSTVKVLVGEKKVLFSVHRDLLTARSDFFRAACSQAWTSAGNRTIALPEQSDNYFDLFVNWLYAPPKSLPQIINADADRSDFSKLPEFNRANATNCFKMLRLIYLWLLADYLGVAALKTDIVDNLLVVKCGFRFTDADLVNRIWDTTMEHSGLRLWMVDYIASRLTLEHLQEGGDRPPGLIAALLMKFVPKSDGTRSPNPEPMWDDRCKYHEHKEGESCTWRE